MVQFSKIFLLFILSTQAASAAEFFTECKADFYRVRSVGKGSTLAAAEQDAGNRMVGLCDNLDNTAQIKACKSVIAKKTYSCEKLDLARLQTESTMSTKDKYQEIESMNEQTKSRAVSLLAQVQALRNEKGTVKPAPDFESQVNALKKEVTQLKKQLSACQNPPAANAASSSKDTKTGNTQFTGDNTQGNTTGTKGNQ